LPWILPAIVAVNPIGAPGLRVGYIGTTGPLKIAEDPVESLRPTKILGRDTPADEGPGVCYSNETKRSKGDSNLVQL
jgi:hypothetical protein